MDEQLKEIEEDIAEDEKIGDDVERMILQQVNVSWQTSIRKKYIFKIFLF